MRSPSPQLCEFSEDKIEGLNRHRAGASYFPKNRGKNPLSRNFWIDKAPNL